MATIKIDGKDYDTDKLSAQARGQLTSLQVTDTEIQRLQIRLATAQTTRSVYAKDLHDEFAK
jgi:hypothetical protein